MPWGIRAERGAKVAAAVIGGELDRLGVLKEALRGRRMVGAEELGRLVAESDYLFWPFPDQDRAADLPQDFLNRLAVQADYWSYRLGELAASLG